MLLSERLIPTPVLEAALEIVTVQVLLVFEVSEVGLHTSEETVVAGAVRLIVVLVAMLLSVAVIVAV